MDAAALGVPEGQLSLAARRGRAGGRERAGQPRGMDAARR